ncbi:MAG: flavodoxin family protein [Spirochaetaceae bacterium]|jgi:multimeric flavodoxin WrbA|nr:flavodoxin family protein [Spirochaetaceae bacterium]
MKVTAFNGSPHDDGVIQNTLELMCVELEHEGIETEIVQAGRENIRGCIDCRMCRELGKCAFSDDIVNSAAEKVNAADGIIIGSPVYYGSIAGNFKCFLDRLFFSGLRLEYKAASAVVSCRRSGGINAFHQMNNYFNLAGAFIVPSVYWGIVHGSSREELLEDAEGIYITKNSARSMAWLIKSLAFSKKEIPLPAVYERPWTNFIH